MTPKLLLQALAKFFLGFIIIGLLIFPLIVKRIRNEEVVLEQGLEGYSEYKQRVKYRLLPFIW